MLNLSGNYEMKLANLEHLCFANKEATCWHNFMKRKQERRFVWCMSKTVVLVNVEYYVYKKQNSKNIYTYQNDKLLRFQTLMVN